MRHAISFKKSFPVLLGTVVEYYDYSLYGFCALILATSFLPASDPSVALITTYGVFAIGSLSKPIGSLIFGWIGDNFGRRAALNITITGIALPTFWIGCMPGYDQIGFMASLMLIGCRFLQGIFVAGEYDGAALYIIEHAQIHRKGLGAALVRTTGVCGLLLGTLMVALFTQKGMPEWAWRIPFLLSLPLGLLTLYLRQAMVETPEFLAYLEKKQPTKKPFSIILKENWKEILLLILLCGAFGGTYQIAVIFLNSYLPLVMPETEVAVAWLNPLVVLFFGLSMPLSGIIADRTDIARMIQAGLIIAMAATIAMITGMIWQVTWVLVLAQLILVMGLGPFNALSHAFVYRFFRVNYRYRCISAGHTIGSMVLSGTAPLLCGILWKTTGLIYAPLIYLGLLIILGYMAVHLGEKWLRKAGEENPQELYIAA